MIEGGGGKVESREQKVEMLMGPDSLRGTGSRTLLGEPQKTQNGRIGREWGMDGGWLTVDGEGWFWTEICAMPLR